MNTTLRILASSLFACAIGAFLVLIYHNPQWGITSQNAAASDKSIIMLILLGLALYVASRTARVATGSATPDLTASLASFSSLAAGMALVAIMAEPSEPVMLLLYIFPAVAVLATISYVIEKQKRT